MVFAEENAALGTPKPLEIENMASAAAEGKDFFRGRTERGSNVNNNQFGCHDGKTEKGLDRVGR